MRRGPPLHSFSILSPSRSKTPSRYARLDALARLARAGREKTGAKRPHLRQTGGLPTCDVADCCELNGKSYKELVKVAQTTGLIIDYNAKQSS